MAIRSSQPGFGDAFLHPSVGRNVQLDMIDASIDWSVVDGALVDLNRGERGAPPYPALLMYKALLLQQWYELSDPGLEEALCDRISFRRFVGLTGDQAVPDHSTLWRFRQALEKSGADQAAFEMIMSGLDEKGLILRQGTMIDASLIEAQSRPPAAAREDEVEPGASKLVKTPREPDANWTKRGAKRIFGYKVHISMDQGSGLVRRILMTPANVNDTVPADNLIMGDEQSVWADKAYDTRARRDRLKAEGVRDRICRRANKHHRLGRWSEKRNKLIGRVRGRVETAFAILKRHYGKGRARYRTIGRNHTDMTMAFLAMNLRRAMVLAT